MNPRWILALALTACGSPQPAEEPPAESANEAPGSAVVPGSVASADGLQISYDVRGEGSTALVFVLCWACDRSFWREQLDVFSCDHKVVAMDLGGHGASKGERDAWTLSSMAEDVEAVIDALSLDRVILVGHSMGGPVSLKVAAAMPDRVQAIVCADTLHDAEVVFPEEAADQMVAAFEADFEKTVESAIDGMLMDDADPALRDWIAERASSVDRTAAVGLMRDFSNLDPKAELGAAGVPIRCINAASRGGPMSPDTNLEGNQKHADFDAVIVDGVGHYIQLEKPEEFNRHLRQILAELGS